MGRFLDEPQKTYKGKFLDEEQATTTPKKARIFSKPTAFGGAVGFGSQPGAEDTLPMIGQITGSVIPGVNSFGGAVGGATLGQAARQGVKAIRGESVKLGQIPKEAVITGVTEGAFRGAGKIISPLLKKGANRMMQSALKASVPVREKYPNLGIDALEEGIYGTRGQMLKKSEAIAKKAESELQKLLSGRPEKVNLKNVIAELGEMKRRALNIGDDATLAQIDDFEKMIMSKSETIPVSSTAVDPFQGSKTVIKQRPTGMFGASQANQLKRDFYSQVSDPSFLKKTGDLAESPEMYRRGAQGLRKEIVGGIEEAGKLDKTASTAIKAQKALKSEEARSLGRVMLPFFETGGAGTALMFGRPDIAAMIGLRRLVSTPFAISHGARALLGTSKSKIPGNVARVGVSEFGRRSFGRN